MKVLNKNIILIGNPIAGGEASKRIKEAVSILKSRGFNVQLMLTAKAGDAELFAEEIRKKYGKSSLHAINAEPRIIVSGGDGTYNEVANGLVNSNIPMAILPFGTSSVLAEELNIPRDLEKSVNAALNGTIQSVYLGRITLINTKYRMRNAELQNPNHNNSEFVTRYFLLMTGIGFDGNAVFRVNKKLKKYFGRGAYILSGFKELINYHPSPITIKGQVELTGYTAVIGKASCYGGNLKITPDAKLTEPYFYVFVTHKKGRLNFIRYVIGIITGQHLNFKDISYFKTAEIEIEGDAHIQIDGDYLGTTPAKIDVVADALKLVAWKP